MRRALLLGLLLLLCSGCAHRVRFESEPVPARVYLEDSFVGYTPLELDLGSRVREVRFESAGFRPVSGILRRRFDPRANWMILFLPGYLLPGVTTRLHERYAVTLERGTEPDDRGVIEAAPEIAPDGTH